MKYGAIEGLAALRKGSQLDWWPRETLASAMCALKYSYLNDAALFQNLLDVEVEFTYSDKRNSK